MSWLIYCHLKYLLIYFCSTASMQIFMETSADFSITRAHQTSFPYVFILNIKICDSQKLLSSPRKTLKQEMKFRKDFLFNFYHKILIIFQHFSFDYGEKFWLIKYKYFKCMCKSDKCKYSIETIERTVNEYNQRHGQPQQ